MRDMNRTEQYLYDRVREIDRTNPNPFIHGAEMAYFVREVAEATALLVSEGYGDAALDYFNDHFHARLAEIRGGAPVPVRLVRPDDPPPPPPPPPLESSRQLELPTEPAVAPATAQDEAEPNLRVAKLRRKAGPFYVNGEDAKNARTKKGLHQYELAPRIGVAQTTISRVERGKSALSVAGYQALRRELGLPEQGPVR
jgi:DNA-binding transcriptional regulator YiaG